jgi:hypothetical protein
MAKANRFHCFLTLNKKFLLSATITARTVDTDVLVNVDDDKHLQEAAALTLLLIAHNIILDDGHRQVLQQLVAEMGAVDPSPVKKSIVTPNEALDSVPDDWSF